MNDATLAKKTGRTEGQIRVQKGWITRGVKPVVTKAPVVAPVKKSKEEKDEDRRIYQRDRNAKIRKEKDAKLNAVEEAPTTAVATTEKVEEPNIHAVGEAKADKVKKEKKSKSKGKKNKSKKNEIKGSKKLKKLFGKIDDTHMQLAEYVVKAYPMAKEMLKMLK
jgi:hypothetical protein